MTYEYFLCIDIIYTSDPRKWLNLWAQRQNVFMRVLWKPFGGVFLKYPKNYRLTEASSQCVLTNNRHIPTLLSHLCIMGKLIWGPTQSQPALIDYNKTTGWFVLENAVLSLAAVLHQSHRHLLHFYKPPNYVTQSKNGYNVVDLPTCEENGILRQNLTHDIQLRRQKLYVYSIWTKLTRDNKPTENDHRSTS